MNNLTAQPGIFVVVGSRDYTKLEDVWRFLEGLPDGSTIYTGDAKGVDEAARNYCKFMMLTCVRFQAHWDDLDNPSAIIRENRFGYKYNAKAGHDRNERMMAEAERNKAILVAAFWDGISKGTENAIQCAKYHHLPILICTRKPFQEKPRVQLLTEDQGVMNITENSFKV